MLYKLHYHLQNHKLLLPKVQIPPFPNQMTGVNPPQNIMDAIVVARYAPLVLPQPMNALPAGDYLNYMPKFTGKEDITAK
jgi:hypothetical protein